MWGKMMFKRGNLDFPVRITTDVINMLGFENPPRLDMLPYPYVDLDWRGCLDILFTQDDPTYDRGKFSIMLQLV